MDSRPKCRRDISVWPTGGTDGSSCGSPRWRWSTAFPFAIPKEAVTPERVQFFAEGLADLTQTERVIFDAYVSRLTTKEIMASLHIKENTLKFHNKNIYQKLGVSSRKELLEIYKRLPVQK
ncbi:MAG: helix-turn-helix transcriptional regulator [Clostridia bacterium]|nr:helix-turn-helix transcriptional regulator [Clostridia bacterium]